jgi:GPI-anchor transamidase subunit K
MHSKGLYKELLLILDTCEAASMFDDVTAPGLILMATAEHDESAIAKETDGEMNIHMQDEFSRQFSEWLHNPAGYPNRVSFTMPEFLKMFPKSSILSQINFKNTTGRDLKDIELRDWIP